MEGSSLVPFGTSRVIGDIWHVMDRLPLMKSHGIRKVFARALRDAKLVINRDDRAKSHCILGVH
ncbi:hypothetical protein LIPSTDRAFT_69509 [Lipomyces starkeyi NRRL Y-11557]|uniref:Uncharacterized protein n=1 Tax=Lipomyces starkeyi NRRL Y-11557 TaxID=675824 RepID=A0A1E3QCF5_LIPST|nr:hypothetical protein LIPSTDRAFT_69509 [Lipomyces starkeyi NRRL Y-11557]